MINKMLKKSHPERGDMAPLFWFILILAGFWVLWYYNGGPQQPDVNQGPFMHPDAPVSDGQGYGQIGH